MLAVELLCLLRHSQLDLNIRIVGIEKYVTLIVIAQFSRPIDNGATVDVNEIFFVQLDLVTLADAVE